MYKRQINGFQGQLKYWWDNFLTEEEHNKILDFKRVTRNANGIEVEESAAAALLIHTITLHFLGNPKEDQASVKSILINLRCPTLSDYRWYKDVFLTNVLKREDGHHSERNALLQDFTDCLVNAFLTDLGKILLQMTFHLIHLPFVNYLA